MNFGYFIPLWYIYDTALFIFMGVKMSDDFAVLDQQKALDVAAGKQSLADDLLAMFIKELPGYKQSIAEHLEQGNKEELRKIVHKIHGGLRYVAAPALMTIVSATDYELFELSDEQLHKNIHKIYHEIDRVLKAEKYGNT